MYAKPYSGLGSVRKAAQVKAQAEHTRVLREMEKREAALWDGMERTGHIPER